MNPLVSIIIPTKNSSEFLEECLKSLKNQLPLSKRGLGGFSFEIIVVDNFSDDDIMEITKR